MTTNWKLGLGFSLVTVVMWGLLPIALKTMLAVMDPLTISWYRFSMSALIALLWYGRKRVAALKNLLARRYLALSLTVVAGLLGNYMLYILGLDRITPGAAQILIQLAPLMLLLGSVALFRERLSLLQWSGVFGLAAGLLLFFHQRITGFEATGSAYLAGIGLIFGAALTWCVYGLAQKKLLVAHHAKDILLLICLAGTLALWPLAEPRQITGLDARELALLAFCGLNTIIAYGCFGLAMSHWESSRVSAILPLAPLLTLLFTFALNHFALAEIPAEPLDALSLFGALLVVAGAGLAALPRKARVP